MIAGNYRRFQESMVMEDRIKQVICTKINVNHLEVVNESYLHAGHAGDDGSGQTHFKLYIVSKDFAGLTRVERQRLVNAALQDCFAAGLHAVSMKLEAA